MTILNSTRNLMDLFVYMREDDEIPVEFVQWSCLALVAACVGDRVFFYRLKDEPLYPNLYTILVDDSGKGKGRAASLVERFCRDIPVVHYRRMKVTAPKLIDVLGKEGYTEEGVQLIPSPKIFLVMPELSFYLGKGEHAQGLIEMMTELYGGSCTFSEGTRMHGDVTVRDPCINWFAGSTKEWLLNAVSPEAIKSGFFARTAVIYGEEKKQKWRPKYQDDYKQVLNYVQMRVLELCNLRGEMWMNPQAESWMESWLANRKEPEDEFLKPTFRRQREMVTKIAMLLSLCMGTSMEITLSQVVRAEKVVRKVVEKNMPDLMEFSNRTPETKNEVVIREMLRRKGEMTQSELTKAVFRHGITGDGVRRGVQSLKQKKLVLTESSGKGAMKHVWVGG